MFLPRYRSLPGVLCGRTAGPVLIRPLWPIMAHMDEGNPNAILRLLTSAIEWLRGRFKPGRTTQPPMAGVREPRRPKPTLPAAAVALEEPPPPKRYRLGSRPDPDRSDLA
jgi:hypothetical protein